MSFSKENWPKTGIEYNEAERQRILAENEIEYQRLKEEMGIGLQGNPIPVDRSVLGPPRRLKDTDWDKVLLESTAGVLVDLGLTPDIILKRKT